MRNRIFVKLMVAFALVILAATVTLDVSIRHAWDESLRQGIERNLRQKTLMLANRVNSALALSTSSTRQSLSELASQEAQAAGARATIIDSQGKVLADSEADPAALENQSTRPEFTAALKGEAGTDARRSPTVGIPFLYVAAPVSGGAVRLAYPLSEVTAALASVRRSLLISSLLAFAVSAVISALAAHLTAVRLHLIVQFADRIAAGDLTRAHWRKIRKTKLATWQPLSIKPPAVSNPASRLCRPVNASSKPCSTVCRTPSSPSVPMIASSGRTTPWTSLFPSTLVRTRH